MSEKDKLFFFKEGLKPWARQELQRARVEDLDTAIAQAESLVDYQSELRREPKPNGNNTPKSGGNKFAKPGAGKSGGERAPSTNNNTPGGQGSGWKSSNNTPGAVQKQGCFICNGPHRMAECPKKKLLNALLAENLDPSHEEPSSSGNGGEDQVEDE